MTEEDNNTDVTNINDKTTQAEIETIFSPKQTNLEKLTQCNDAIIGSSKELTHLVRDMDKLAKDIERFNNQGSKVVQDLHGETFILRKLPERMQEKLRAIVPEIGKEIQTIHTDLLIGFNDNIKICQNNLKSLSEEAKKFISTQSDQANKSMDQLLEKSQQLSKFCIRKTWMTMLVVAIVSTIVSVAGCYFTLAQMPSPYNVTIDAAKNIYIDKSPVTIWGEKGLDIYKPEKK
jgi:hypothetical protein